MNAMSDDQNKYNDQLRHVLEVLDSVPEGAIPQYSEGLFGALSRVEMLGITIPLLEFQNSVLDFLDRVIQIGGEDPELVESLKRARAAFTLTLKGVGKGTAVEQIVEAARAHGEPKKDA